MSPDPLFRMRRWRALAIGVAALAVFALAPRMSALAAAPAGDSPFSFVSSVDDDDDDGYRSTSNRRYDNRGNRRAERRDRRADRRYDRRQDRRYDRRQDRRYDNQRRDNRRYERRTRQPSRRHVWIPGHYSYDRHLRRDVWVRGHWTRRGRR